jgi:cytochrome c oxidase subunit II
VSGTRRTGKRRLLLLLPLLALTGCGGRQSPLSPQSHQAGDIASLWWWMFGGACVGFAAVAAILALAWARRNRRGVGDDNTGAHPGERFSTRIVLGFGVALPIVVLVTLFAIADIFVLRATQAPAAARTALTVEVIGHQWWWEVRYPGTPAVSANEIHIPVRTPVLVRATTADVVHSFWVPELNRTIDMIPGRVNAIELDARRAGTYRGQCDEFCGLQHAHMAFVVVAEPAQQFRAWLTRMARPAADPASPLERHGATVFLDGACSSCHTIRGTSASGDVGPDLTHVASRETLGALTVANTPAGLASWLTDSQHVKPGNQMPDLGLTPNELHALVAYLGSLR